MKAKGPRTIGRPRNFSARSDRAPGDPTVFAVLDVLADLLKGGRHSRTTISRGWRISLPTADRWMKELLARVPAIVRVRVGKHTWIEWARSGPKSKDNP